MNYLAPIAINTKSFNATRTAICCAISENALIDITKFEDMKRLSKGNRVINPKRSKYSDMWDPHIFWDAVLEGRFGSGRPNIDLRTKTAMLIRLSIAARNFDVAHIYRPSIEWTDSTVKFKFYKFKTQHIEAVEFSRTHVIRKLPSHLHQICAYSSLKSYLDLNSSHYRPSQKGIWLHYNFSSEVSHQCLAKDTRDAMDRVGIPSKYRSGTLRHAAITFFRTKKFSRDEVKARTGHKNDHVIDYFYDFSEKECDLLAKIFENQLEIINP
jgi:hypothetical protein